MRPFTVIIVEAIGEKKKQDDLQMIARSLGTNCAMVVVRMYPASAGESAQETTPYHRWLGSLTRVHRSHHRPFLFASTACIASRRIIIHFSCRIVSHYMLPRACIYMTCMLLITASLLSPRRAPSSHRFVDSAC